MSVLFRNTSVKVDGFGLYTGEAQFESPLERAEVALRGLDLPKYKHGDLWHYRGITVIKILSVDILSDKKKVKFSFEFKVGQSEEFQMEGAVDFLVIGSILK